MTKARALLGAGLLATVVAPAVDALRAATVEVTVVERGAGAVQSQSIVLYPATPGMQDDPYHAFRWRAAGRCTTGPSGRCTIASLPAGVVPAHLALPVKLERGQRVRAEVDIDAVGGSIEIEAAAGAARLAGAAGATLIEPAQDGTIEFRGVVPGSYGVELCDDARCDRIARRWSNVGVAIGRKVTLTR